ncbi:MAG: cytochrome c oxidase subunit I [Anaerolineaceae bacterium]|nr:MAG: cytochrome c oxidase subunit I [Anaerolineaceae bacterium]
MATASYPMDGVAGQVKRPALAEYFTWSIDHKIIGVQYIVTSLFFFIIAGALAMLIRWELMTPEITVMADGSQYNTLFSIHGTMMIFTWIVPFWAGLGNYLIPLMLGAKDMAFPWLNAFAFWLLPPSGFLLILGFFIGPAEAGWTSYPPLSTIYSPDGQTLWALSIHLVGLSSILGAINFIVTIKNMRPPSMGWFQMPLFAWATLATSIIVVLATPFLAGALTLLLLDRVAGTTFFDATSGGDVLLWQNIFWFYSHPAVYIMILPGFGVLSEVLAIHSRKPIFGYRMIALSSMAIAIVGFTVWAHHMFTSLQPELRIPFMITSMIIAVPTGIKIFGWLGTIWGGRIRLNSANLFSLGFLSLFVIGGISGVMLAAVPVNIHMHDTYFVVSHFHFVLYGGSVFAIYSALYHWWPKITGRMLDERLGKIHFVTTYIGFLGTFMPQHIVGMQGMPRRVAVYDPQFQDLNVLISLFSFLLGISTFFLLYNMVVSTVAGRVAGANPWRALTLEWQTTSPPPAYNFAGEPVPFEDPYGYGTDASKAYLDAMESRFGPSPGAEEERRPPSGALPEPQPAGD